MANSQLNQVGPFAQRLHHTIATHFIVWFACLTSSGLSAETESLKSGDAFTRQLAAMTGIQRSAQPIRAGVVELANVHRVALFFDRRVDPDQEVELKIVDASLDEVFRHIAFAINMGVSYTSSVVYIGPPATAENLATVAALRREDAGRLNPSLQKAWQRAKAWEWNELATPRDLIDDLASEVGVRITNPELIPHDLWAANRLPTMEVADRFTLLLAGFGLTFQFDKAGEQIDLVPFPDQPSIQRTYSVPGNFRSEVLAHVAPNARVDRRGTQISVSGKWEDQEAIQRHLRGGSDNRTPKRTGGEKRYSLKITDAPIGTVIQSIASQVMLQVDMDDRAKERMSKLVTFKVQNVKLEELLRIALDQAELSFFLENRRLRIEAK